MKWCLTLLLLMQLLFAPAQSTQSENIFIITLDGVRWQEIFSGADATLINNTRFTKDTSLAKQMFWDKSVAERRKKLMPFFWSIIAQRGQLYGNRKYRNKVNVANNHRFSYPGYNEILTGYPAGIHSNKPVENKNTNILEFLNNQPAYNDKVVAFTSWSIFPKILGTQRNELPVYSGYTPLPDTANARVQLLNKLQEEVIVDTNATRYDALTFVAAKEYVAQHLPKVVYISFGDPDECAHRGEYDQYLQSLNNIDRMIAQLWYFIQSNPNYKDKTSLLITTDHGRGKKVKHWKSHNFLLRGSADIWLALLGPDIKPAGEIKMKQQIYQEQIANTIAALLGTNFTTGHPVAEPIELSVGH
ncbi:phosphoglyceromutase [Ilyomonas limi]|uniref:Phosphoglyceromutase n=1 Tax=Ilyomonas limi TaxID=2575867 RepID=A0A4U3KWF4_9BACT|nr:phosphoglyceromutase [Ilyomonas limi]TKK66169.1 phosphoglyceromutase [Ilyomonas limi]